MIRKDSSNKKLAKIIGTQVRTARAKAGISGPKLAKKMGRKPSSFCPWLSRLEAGMTMPSLPSIRKLEKTLKVRFAA